MNDELRKRYSAIIAYSPSIGKDKVDLEIEKFHNLIKELEGSLEKFEYLGIKKLAYAIQKHETAHFVQYYFNLESNKHLKKNISEINRKIGSTINLNTIRHMVVKLEHYDFNFSNLRNYEGFDNNMKI